MQDILFNLNKIRTEISFKTLDELRCILSFCKRNNLNKINIPCKNNIKKDFLLNSIKLSREEYPNINIIPHFSILHEFKRNKLNTQESFIKFIQVVKSLGCDEVLLISGSQKRSTLDAVSMLYFLKNSPLFYHEQVSIGVAFNPYLPSFLFDQEIIRLEKKLKSGLVNSIWIQFGTDLTLFKSRIEILKKIIYKTTENSSRKSKIILFGSTLIPSKQFLARFKYRPWKGVYCSSEFMQSVDYATDLVTKLLETYKEYQISPIIETNISTDVHLKSLKNILKF